jgi:predicted O-methyltransferase YrrM
MREFGHWTPRYVAARTREIIYHRGYPDHPWLTRAANEILQSLLRKEDVGLEFGSGRSTLWFAKRIKHLTSVEHDEHWFKKVKSDLESNALYNVDYLFKPASEGEPVPASPYLLVVDKFSPNSLDFVLVDGAYRSYCALGSIGKLRPGGILIIDNVNWFLPCTSVSPNSNPVENPQWKGVWRQVHEALQDWRVIWTSSGVSNTALFFKPCGAAG